MVGVFKWRWFGKWHALAAGGLALVLALLGYGFWGEAAWPVTVLQPQELVQSVVATATVQARHRASVGTQVAGTVVEVKVLEGDRFRTGQVLLRLDDREARAAVSAADLAVRQAELKWREWRDVQAPVARESDRQAQANLVQARAQFERQQDLFRQGFVGQAALDEALRAWRVAEAQARSASAQGQAHVEGGIEQELTRSTLVQAQANLAAARARLSYTEVKAAFDGLVVSRSVEPGDTVQPGKTLLVLAPDGVTELVAQIDERNLSLLKVGQSALASADAYAGQKFQATISSIAPGVDPARGAVQVKLQVHEPPGYLRQDMTISVEIEVARKAVALALPVDAVHDIDAAQPWVWQVDGEGHAQRAPVKLGVRSGTRVEALSGLLAGAHIVAVAAPGLAQGQRVRAVRP
jgi:HlyD family secretion protein